VSEALGQHLAGLSKAAGGELSNTPEAPLTDEACTSTAMVRSRGRCPRGVRLIGHVPQGHWKTITFVAGLRHRAWSPPWCSMEP
jgi:hypothetical protein